MAILSGLKGLAKSAVAGTGGSLTFGGRRGAGRSPTEAATASRQQFEDARARAAEAMGNQALARHFRERHEALRLE